jgi:hypothetical protein
MSAVGVDSSALDEFAGGLTFAMVARGTGMMNIGRRIDGGGIAVLDILGGFTDGTSIRLGAVVACIRRLTNVDRLVVWPSGIERNSPNASAGGVPMRALL